MLIFDERPLECVADEQKLVIGILIDLGRHADHTQSYTEWMRLKKKKKLMESAMPLLHKICYRQVKDAKLSTKQRH